MKTCMKTPQNQKFITYSNAARGGLSHGPSRQAQKFGEFELVVFLKICE